MNREAPPSLPPCGRVDIEYLVTTAAMSRIHTHTASTAHYIRTARTCLYAHSFFVPTPLLANSPFLFLAPLRLFPMAFFCLLLGIFHLIYALLVGRTLCLSYLAFGIIDNFYLVFSFRCRHRHRRRRLRRCGVLFFPTFSRRCIAKTFARSSRCNFHLYILSLADCFVDLFRSRLSYCSTDKYISQRETSEH